MKDGWEKIRFSDFVQINPEVKLTRGEEYCCVMMDAIEPGRRYVYPLTKKEFKGGGAKFRSGDTLFARITPCLENGKIVQFKSRENEVGFGSTEYFVFRAKDNISDPDYVFYLSLTETIRKPAEKSMFGVSGRQRADLDSIRDLEIQTPTLPTQRKIASILSAYDDLIENNTCRIKILEEMAQAIYREWFVEFRAPLRPAPSRWDESPFGNGTRVPSGNVELRMATLEEKKLTGKDVFPVGWMISQLDHFAVRKMTRFIEDEHSDLPLLDLSRIPRKSCAVNQFGTADEIRTSRIIFEKDDALFGAIRPYFHKVILAPMQGITNVSVFVLRPQDGSISSYVFAVLFSEATVAWASQHSGGTKMPVITWDILREMPTLLPARQLLCMYEDIVRPTLDMIHNLVKQNINLRRTRDLLLPKLISGEVDVENSIISEADITI